MHVVRETTVDAFKVYAEVMHSISRSRVEMLVGWELIEWNLKSDDQKVIESIVVRSKGERKKIECDALVNFNEKTINMKIFLGEHHDS